MSQFNVAIVGMGDGGNALLQIFQKDPKVTVVAVCSRNLDRVSMKWAKSIGIHTTTDYKDLANIDGIDIIIDASGSHDVADFFEQLEESNVEVLSGVSALLMWRMVEEREEKERKTTQLLAQQQYLYEIGIALSSLSDSRQALDLIITAGMDMLSMVAGSVAIFDETSATLQIKACVGMEGSVSVGSSWEISPRGFSNHVLNSATAVVVEDLAKETRFDTERLVQEGFMSLIAVPLRLEKSIVGVLYLDDRKARGFTEHEINTIGLLGSMAGSAIEKILMLENAEQRATTDELTRLKNHRFFMSSLIAEVKRATRYNEEVSLFMIDVDNFKNLNDTHGHLVGNDALKALSRLLTEHARDPDIIARYGGEEFVMLLPKTSKEEAFNMAERVRKLVESSTFPGGDTQPNGRLTISIGVASFPDDCASPNSDSYQDLLSMADKALYKSKHIGRNCVTAYGKTV